VKVLGISSSPRAEGNSDLLLREALAGAESAGAAVEYLSLRGAKIGPCIECNACYREGACVVRDGYQEVFEKLLAADRLVFATPIFFMGVCAQAKLLVDRCQCLWARKYILKQPLYEDGPRDRRAMVIAVGGCSSKKMFDSVRLTFRYFFDALEMRCAGRLFVNRVDDKGEILEHPQAMPEARRLGAALAGTDPLPEKPETVLLSGNASLPT
jgi:multimeric flavodoxin WrbA